MAVRVADRDQPEISSVIESWTSKLHCCPKMSHYYCNNCEQLAI